MIFYHILIMMAPIPGNKIFSESLLLKMSNKMNFRFMSAWASLTLVGNGLGNLFVLLEALIRYFPVTVSLEPIRAHTAIPFTKVPPMPGA